MTLNNTANVYDKQGHPEQALELYRRAVAVEEKLLGADHPNVALTLSNIALVYDGQGRNAEALELYARALAVSRTALGVGPGE